jgi:general stress protein 26
MPKGKLANGTQGIPKPGRPTMPGGYGIAKGPKGLLAWKDVEQQLAKAKNYWVATTRPDGRPHAMPVWGLWLDGVFYFSSDGSSRKARNIAASGRAVVHLESGDDAVIIEGEAERIMDRAMFAKVDAA